MSEPLLDGNASPAYDEVSISIPSDAEYVRVVRLAIMGVASRMPFTFEDIEDIKLAVSEACNNAILHSRPAPGTKFKTPVTVRFQSYSDRLVIAVEDEGHIPPPGLIAPPSPLVSSELPEGGMGLFLMETLMDEIENETGERTVVRLTKYLPAQPLASEAENSNVHQNHRGTDEVSTQVVSTSIPTTAL